MKNISTQTVGYAYDIFLAALQYKSQWKLKLESEVAGPSHHDQQLCNRPCSRNKEEGLLLTCNVCYSWSHATCYRFNNDTGLPRAFVCLDCHYINRGVCIDSKLLSAQPDQRKLFHSDGGVMYLAASQKL